MPENLEYTIEPAFSEGRRQPGYVLYEWGVYEPWSVLAGQNRKSARDHADTIDELRDRWPLAEVHDERVDAGNTVDHLPGEEWDDARQTMKNCDECGGAGVVFLISLTDPPTRTTDEIRVERCEKCNRYADNIGAATAVINEWYDAEEIRNGG